MSVDQHDPYDKGTGGKPGKPVLSWKKADVGDALTGVVVPPNPDLPEKGYAVSQEWDNDERQPKVWAPRGYLDAKGNSWRGPITEADYIRHVGNANDARPVTRSDVTLVTDLRNMEFVSGPAKQRAQENGEADDGIRRVIMDGQSIRESHEAALAAIGADRPQPGQTWTVRLAAQTPNDKQGHTNTIEVTIKPPTPESMEVVKAYLAKAKEEAAAGSDPYVGAGAGGRTEEPPF
jgi:hypothetical protein